MVLLSESCQHGKHGIDCIECYRLAYHDLLQDHHSLCGTIEELKEESKQKDLQIETLKKECGDEIIRARYWEGRWFSQGAELGNANRLNDDLRKALRGLMGQIESLDPGGCRDGAPHDRLKDARSALSDKRICAHKKDLSFDGLGVRPRCQLCKEWITETE